MAIVRCFLQLSRPPFKSRNRFPSVVNCSVAIMYLQCDSESLKMRPRASDFIGNRARLRRAILEPLVAPALRLRHLLSIVHRVGGQVSSIVPCICISPALEPVHHTAQC